MFVHSKTAWVGSVLTVLPRMREWPQLQLLTSLRTLIGLSSIGVRNTIHSATSFILNSNLFQMNKVHILFEVYLFKKSEPT